MPVSVGGHQQLAAAAAAEQGGGEGRVGPGAAQALSLPCTCPCQPLLLLEAGLRGCCGGACQRMRLHGPAATASHCLGLGVVRPCVGGPCLAATDWHSLSLCLKARASLPPFADTLHHLHHTHHAAQTGGQTHLGCEQTPSNRHTHTPRPHIQNTQQTPPHPSPHPVLLTAHTDRKDTHTPPTNQRPYTKGHASRSAKWSRGPKIVSPARASPPRVQGRPAMQRSHNTCQEGYRVQRGAVHMCQPASQQGRGQQLHPLGRPLAGRHSQRRPIQVDGQAVGACALATHRLLPRPGPAPGAKTAA
jgi:hypothetical protein